MGLVRQLRSTLTGGDSESSDQKPTHRCRDCGEEYHSEIADEIRECHGCGGVNVESV